METTNMQRRTKTAVLETLEEVLLLKRQLSFQEVKRSYQAKKFSRVNLSAKIFLKLAELVVLSDREAVIEPSKINTEALLAACFSLYQFFKDVVVRLPIQPDWEKISIQHGFLNLSFTLSASIISPDRVTLEKARKELREHAEELQRGRERARRELIDQTEIDEEVKQMTLEDAVIVIQKIERVYQAISRFNYLRHVYQRAMDLREGEETMSAEQSIVRIQARTRGYFARKRVREMRQKELDLLQMSTSALLDSMRLNKVISEILPISLSPVKTLDELINNLKDNFFPAAMPEKEDGRLLQRQAETEALYHDLCLKRIVKENKRPRLLMNELVSDITPISIGERKIFFDLRLYLNCFLLIPLALRGWSQKTNKRWILLTGPPGSGKTAWMEAVVAASGAVHLRFTASSLIRRRSIRTIIKFIRADPCVVVTVDCLEVFKLTKRTTSGMQNVLKILLTELHAINVFLIGMSRVEQLHPQILALFPDIVHLQPLNETKKIEVISRFLVRLQDVGRLPNVAENLGKLRKETEGLCCGETGKVVRRGRTFGNV